MHNFPPFFNVFGERGRELNIWTSYQKEIREAQTIIVALGGNDIRKHPRKEGPILYGQHFCSFTTKLVHLRDNVHFNDELIQDCPLK